MSLVVMATDEVVVIVVAGVMDCRTRVAAVMTGGSMVVCRCGRRSCSSSCRCRVGPSALSPAVLSLGVFLGLHSPVLEPYLDLPLCQVEVSGQLPPLLFGDVSVE